MKYLILFLLTCCSPSAPNLFKLDGFSKEQRVSIENAANEWCNKSHGKYCPALIYQDIDDLNYSKFEYTNSLDHGGQYDIGMTTHYPNDLYRIQIKECPTAPEAWCTERIRRVALHEFGHTFNKPESNIKGTIMYPDISYQSLHLTEEDIK